VSASKRKSLARSFGEFFGHIARGVKTDPATDARRSDTREVQRTVEEHDQGDVILRRTVIDEVQLKNSNTDPNPHQEPPRHVDE
jgi:hypothetical protein